MTISPGIDKNRPKLSLHVVRLVKNRLWYFKNTTSSGTVAHGVAKDVLVVPVSAGVMSQPSHVEPHSEYIISLGFRVSSDLFGSYQCFTGRDHFHQ